MAMTDVRVLPGEDVQVSTPSMAAPSDTKRSARKKPAHLEQAGSDALGEALKQHYNGLVSEPVPGRFLELLAALEAKRDA